MPFNNPNAYHLFARRIVASHRYIIHPDGQDFLRTLLRQARRRVELIPKRAALWRAQLGAEETDDGQPVALPPTRMRPLKNRGREGRANPKGIPYLYVANTKETAMAEVRPWLRSDISVALFKPLRVLRIVRCYAESKRRHFFGGTPRRLWNQSVWHDIDDAFSQPVSPTDDYASYAPTQVLAEFFKSHGYDGVAYRSALVEKGFNIVLFDADAVVQVNGTVYEARRISFDFQQTSNSYYLLAALPRRVRRHRAK